MTRSVSINNKPTVEIDSTTPVEVNHSGDITIDTSTPLSTNANITNTNLDVTVQGTADVNVTNATLATNATIQNASLDVNLTDLNGSLQLPVSVDNQPTVTVGNSNLDVTVQNSSINTNATIQNSSLNTYNYVYDGSTWRFQLSDSSGKAIGLDHTYYTSSEITALGSSTDINLWLAAYNDSMLQNKWVASYNDEFEETVYYQHPSLGNGTKCLRLVYQYSTQNTQTVVESIVAAVADWNYSDELQGSVSVSVTNQVDPNPNSAIPVHTKVADIAFTVNTVGTATISLSGTNASLYHIYDTTTSTGFSSGTFSSSGVYELHVASDYSGSSYSHSLNIDIVGDLLGPTDSATLSISGTYSGAASFANEYAIRSQTSITNQQGSDFQLSSTNKSFWPSLGTASGNLPEVNDDLSISFWFNFGAATSGADVVFENTTGTTLSTRKGIFIYKYFYNSNFMFEVFYISDNNKVKGVSYSLSGSTYENTWRHITLVKTTGAPSSSTITLYIDGASQGVGSNVSAGSSIPSTSFDVSAVDGNIFTNTNWLTYTFNRSGLDIRMDELATFNRALTSSEVSTLYNSGTPFDYTTLSGYGLDRYFRFGDGSTDNVSTHESFDQVNTSDKIIDGTLSSDADVYQLSSSETPYVPASGSFTNTEYISGTIATGNLSKKGLYSTNTFTNNKGWFPSYDQNNHFWTQTDVSISFWYKGVTNSNYLVPWYQYYATSSTSNMGGLAIWLGGGKIYLLRHADDSAATNTNIGWSLSSMTSWTHICIEMDSNASLQSSVLGASLYVNGVNQGAGTTSINGNDPSATTLVRSGFCASAPQYNTSDSTWSVYGGSDTPSIDEISTWKIKMSDVTGGISELYNSGTPTDLTTHSSSANLERWIRCGDVANDGTSIFDYSDSNFELTSWDSTDRTTSY